MSAYRSPNVARLAGAAVVPTTLAAWGLLWLGLTGVPTATTWALGLAFLFPASALLLVVAREGTLAWKGVEYVDGFFTGVMVLAAAFLAGAAVDIALVRAVSVVGAVELVAVGLVFTLLAGLLVVVDARYVERRKSAARLEAEYLKNPDDAA